MPNNNQGCRGRVLLIVGATILFTILGLFVNNAFIVDVLIGLFVLLILFLSISATIPSRSVVVGLWVGSAWGIGAGSFIGGIALNIIVAVQINTWGVFAIPFFIMQGAIVGGITGMLGGILGGWLGTALSTHPFLRFDCTEHNDATDNCDG